MSRSESQQSCEDITPEHAELLALTEELELTYSEYVEEHERLWENLKASLQRVCGNMYEGSLERLAHLKDMRGKRHTLEGQIEAAQDFVEKVKQFCGS